MSPALASGFLTTGPPGKSSVFLKSVFWFFLSQDREPEVSQDTRIAFSHSFTLSLLI